MLFFDNSKIRLIGINDSESNDSLFLFTMEELEELQNTICSELGYPTTVLYKCNNEYERVDSSLSRIAYRKECHILRNHICSEKCKKCDKIHADILFQLDSGANVEELLQNIIDKHYNDCYEEVQTPSLKKYEGKEYIEYDCPILGFRELVFPIKINNQIIAAFFVGQIDYSDNRSIIQKQKARFVSKYAKELKDSYYKCNGNEDVIRDISIRNKENILECLTVFSNDEVLLAALDDVDSDTDLTLHIKYNKASVKFNSLCKILLEEDVSEAIISRSPKSKNEYAELITKSIKLVEEIEKRIYNKLVHKANYDIHCRVAKIIDDFYSRLNIIEKVTYESRKKFWEDIVKGTLIGLKNKLDLRNIILFAESENDSNKLNNVVQLTSIHNNNTISFFSLKKMIEFEDINLKNKSNSYENEHLFKCLDNECYIGEQKEKKILIYFPLSFSPTKSISILICFRDEISKIDEEIIKNFIEDINLLLSSIVSVYASINDQIKTDEAKNINVIYRHEISHHLQAIQRINSMYFSSYSKYTSKDAGQVNNAHENMDGVLKRMLFISQNTKFIYDTANVKKASVSAFYEFLYKFRSIYRAEGAIEHKDIIVHPREIYDNLRRNIYTDVDLFDLIVNNLVSNAIKYSYWGTKIYIDCSKLEIKSKHSILSIIDYGMQLYECEDEKDEIFKLYYRGKEAEKTDSTGLGIGFHVIKRLCDLLKYEIKTHQHEISSCNVPLLYEYIKREKENKIDRLKKHSEYKRKFEILIDEGKIDLIVNTGEMYYAAKRSNHQIIRGIDKPTYEVKCEVYVVEK